MTENSGDARKHLLIVYHSQGGHTEAMAQAVYQGALELQEETETRLRKAFDADQDDIYWSDGLIIGTPENFGYMSGAIKDFFDRTYYQVIEKVDGRPYALFIRAGNDGTGAVFNIERILAGLAWKKVNEPVMAVGEFKEAYLQQCRELGQTMAAGIAYSIF